MSLVYNNFVIEQGASWEQPLVYKTGNPLSGVNLSGMSAFANFAVNYGEEPFLRLTTENSGVIFGTGLGEISLVLTTGQTANLCPGKCVVKVGLINGGFVDYIVGGEVSIQPGVF